MARTSKREAKALNQKNHQQKQTAAKKYRTAIYVRLSVEDDRKIESNTVENQTALLTEYVNSHEDMELVECYCDRGVTGTKFDRPDFNRMAHDMRSGRFNCIVVKDLSRLGRNYLETGEYIEKIFPIFGIRFISVTDGYDSLVSNPAEDGMIVPLKNLINEAYAKDISQKIGAAIEAKQKQGKFIGSRAPYGYMKSPENHHILIPNPETMENVKRIFQCRAEGMSLMQIARMMNQEKILSPMQYRYRKGIDASDKYADVLWDVGLVKTMLRNPVYIGDMEQGYEKTSLCKGIATRTQKKEDYIYVTGTHEALVSKEIFDKVQKLLDEQECKSRLNKDKYKNMERRQDIFQGILYCADCNKKLGLYRRTVKLKNGYKHYYTYICSNTASYGKDICKPKNFKMENLEMLVGELIKKHIDIYMNLEQSLRKLNGNPAVKRKKNEYRTEIEKLEKELDLIDSRSAGLYDDFTAGIIREKEYLSFRKDFKDKKDAITDEISRLKEDEKTYEEDFGMEDEIYQNIRKFGNFKELTREIILAFISKITFYGDKRFEIEYKFDIHLKELAELIRQREEECI